MNYGGGGGGTPPYGMPPYNTGIPMYSPYGLSMQQMGYGGYQVPNAQGPPQTSGQGPLGLAQAAVGANGLYQAPEPDKPEEHEAMEFIRLNPGEAVKYDEYWAEASGGEETVSGKDARAVLGRAAKVSKTQLRLIWEIADHLREGELNRNQFLIALRLIALAQRGAEISIKGLRNFVGINLVPNIAPPPQPEKNPEPPAGTSASPGTSASGFSWTVTSDVTARYDNFFTSLDSSKSGFVDGKAGAAFFGKSGLPRPTLKRVWQLADITRDGKLDLQEFRQAMHMVANLRTGHLALDALPPNLDPDGQYWLRSDAGMREITQNEHQQQQQVQQQPQPQQLPHQAQQPYEPQQHQKYLQQNQLESPPLSSSSNHMSPSDGLVGPRSGPGVGGDTNGMPGMPSVPFRQALPEMMDGDLLGGVVPVQSSPRPRSVPGSPVVPGAAIAGQSTQSENELREKLLREQQEAARAQQELNAMRAEMERLRLEQANEASRLRQKHEEESEVEQMRRAYQEMVAAKARAEQEASNARLEAAKLKEQAMSSTFHSINSTPTSTQGIGAGPGDSIWSEPSASIAKRPAKSPQKARSPAHVALPSTSLVGAAPALSTVNNSLSPTPSAQPARVPGAAFAKPVSTAATSAVPPPRADRLISDDDSVSDSDDDDFWGSSGAGAKPTLVPSNAAGGNTAASGGFGNDLDEWAF